MTQFSTQKNKLSEVYNKTQDNQVTIERLNVKKIIQPPITFNKNRNEIILVNKVHILPNKKWEDSYQFNNFNTKYLHFLKPYAILSTLSAYNFDSEWVYFYNYYWWEVYSTIAILKYRTNGYLISSLSPTVYAPVYLTVKIQVYNRQLFSFFKSHK